MKLRDYILKHYNGRNVDFAAANEMTAQQVGQMVKKGVYYIYDGMLVIARRDIKSSAKKTDGDARKQQNLLK